LLVFFEGAAAITGRWGSSVKGRSFVDVSVIILLVTTLIFAGGLYSVPVRQNGNLIVSADENYRISGGKYVQAGNIVVKDNASLLIENCELTVDEQVNVYTINVQDQGHLDIEGSTFYVLNRRYQEQGSAILVSDNATALVRNSQILTHWIVASQNARVESVNTNWTYGYVYAENNSEVNMIDSMVAEGTVFLSENSSVHFINSVAPGYSCGDTATLFLEDSNRQSNAIITYGSLTCTADSTIRLTNSTLDYVSANEFTGIIISNKSVIVREISIANGATFRITGDLAIPANVTGYNGYVTRRYTVLTAPNLQLNVTGQDTNQLLWKGQSDQNGLGAFDIFFMPWNHTRQLSLSGRLTFNFTSTTPLILASP
jgi:hypothetical protein